MKIEYINIQNELKLFILSLFWRLNCLDNFCRGIPSKNPLLKRFKNVNGLGPYKDRIKSCLKERKICDNIYFQILKIQSERINPGIITYAPITLRDNLNKLYTIHSIKCLNWIFKIIITKGNQWVGVEELDFLSEDEFLDRWYPPNQPI